MSHVDSIPHIKSAVVPTSISRTLMLRNRSAGPPTSRRTSSIFGSQVVPKEFDLLGTDPRVLEFTDSPVRGRLLHKSKSVLSFTILYDSPSQQSNSESLSASCTAAPKACKNKVGPVKAISHSPSLKSSFNSKLPNGSHRLVEVPTSSKAVQCDLIVSSNSEKTDGDKESVKGDHSSDDRSDEFNANLSQNGVSDSPEKKARRNHRTKNYLHGNYTTLSYAEIDRLFPERKLSILVGTWNMNGKAPPSTLDDLILPTRLSSAPDVVVVCTQESHSSKFSWEVSLQETLGPDHVMLSASSFGTLHLSVFLRRELIWICSLPEDASFSVRPGTKFRTKGAVAVGLSIFGTSFLFICSHLTAHTERLTDRVTDIKRISMGIELPKVLPLKYRHKDVTLNYDCVFWAGDLNFRLASQRLDVIENVSNGWRPFEKSCGAEMAQRLLVDDQLKQIMKNGEALKGFEEGTIAFPPTYKYVPGSNEFDKSKDRTPSYTDRILFRTKVGTEAECLEYDSVTNITSSDHKPVWGSYTVSVKPGSSKVPLAAGLFNRAVYIEGTKRWAEIGWARKSKLQNSAAKCVIQ